MPDLAHRIASLSPEKREALRRRLEARGISRGESPIALRADRRTAPPSFAQERLLFLDQLEPGVASYNVPRAIRIRGSLDPLVLERALSEIVRRHESLRTRFHSEDGKLLGLVSEDSFRLARIDLSSLPAPKREEEARRLAAEEAERPFDLSSDSVLRATLVALGREDHVLLMTLHHIATDAWSTGVLFRELSALYGAFAAGLPSPLPEPPIQYGDFAAWQREWLSGEVLREQLSYWKAELAGAPPVLELPTDRPRPAVGTYRGASRTEQFPRELSDAFRELARREGVTLFMALVAVFDVLLARYTGQEDVVVGTPIANRGRRETEELIGFFINTLALRTSLSGDPTFRELFARVRATALGAYAHQDLPFEKLVEELRPQRDLARNPIFQVMIALRNTPPQPLSLPGLALESLDVRRETSKFELALHFDESSDGLRCTVEYSTELFDEPTIARLTGHFRTLLTAAVADPEQRVAAAPLLTAGERRQILVEWNDTARRPLPSGSIPGLFEARAAAFPNAPAVVDGEERLSASEVNARANRLARALLRSGAGPGERVAVCLERSADAVVALLAAMKTGAAYVPLDPSYPVDRLAFMLSDSSARVLVTRTALASRMRAAAPATVLVDGDARILERESSQNLGTKVESDDAAYVIYTSGSTGTPKGVVGVHGASLNRFAWMWRAYPFETDEVCCQKTSLSFVDSIWEIFGPLLAGVPLVVIPEDAVKDPEALVAALATAGATRIVLVPSLLAALLDFAEERLASDLPRLLHWTTSGETLPLDLFLRFRAALPDRVLLNLYGSSEVAADVTAFDASRWVPVYTVPIGRPIDNTKIFILDPTRQPVPIGVPGELFVGGSSLARGYWNAPELTSQRFVSNPFASGDSRDSRLFRTGDVARFLPDGEIEYLGRVDHQVKIRGHRVEPGEIESALEAQPGVHRSVVVARADSTGEKRLIAYVVGNPASPPRLEQLRRALELRLPSFLVPFAFVVLDSLPLTGSGKVDRKRLPEPDESRRQIDEPFVAPRTAQENALAAIWRELLGLEQVGVRDDFFSLGGHSLLALRVVARIRAALGVDLPLRALFEAPRIEDLALRVESLRGEKREERIARRADPSSAAPLSFSQQRLWVLDQVNPGNTSYLIRRAVRLKGSLDPGLLRRAVEAVAARHEILRTRFVSVGGVPGQLRDSDARVAFDTVDLSTLPPGEIESEVFRLASEEGARPIDLESGPPLRSRLLVISPEEHVLLVTLHHIAGDGWSLGIFFRELSAIYAALATGRAPELSELLIQYADFAAWQRARLDEETLQSQLAYWRRRLSGVPASIDLATDHPSPSERSGRGGRCPLVVAPPVAEALRELSRQERATTSMTFLAAFAALLSRYTTREDILVGSPTPGRDRPETEDLIGLFVNTLVLRVSVAGDPSFRELVSRARDSALGAYAHPDVPFEKLVEELRPPRVPGQNPIFQVWFVLQNAPARPLSLPGIESRAMDLAGGSARHDLQLSIRETREGISGVLDYAADLFEESSIERMARRFEELLSAVSARPDERLSAVYESIEGTESRRRAEEARRLADESRQMLRNVRRKAVRT